MTIFSSDLEFRKQHFRYSRSGHVLVKSSSRILTKDSHLQTGVGGCLESATCPLAVEFLGSVVLKGSHLRIRKLVKRGETGQEMEQVLLQMMGV